jgi:sulfite oxidase
MPQLNEDRPLKQVKPQLRLLEGESLNAEAMPHMLDEPLTPVSSFFVRNNGFLPQMPLDDMGRWVLAIDGEVDKPQIWTLAELQASFPHISVTAVLECAGNGRSGFPAETTARR